MALPLRRRDETNVILRKKQVGVFSVYARLYDSRKLGLVIRWSSAITIDLIYLLLVDKVTGASVNMFLNPSEKEFLSPLDFHPDSCKYVIHVYGLTTKETETGRFYQLSGYSKRRLKVEDVTESDVKIVFNIKETVAIDLPLRDEPPDMLDVTIVRCPPASYTVTAKTTQPVTYVVFLKQLHQTFVFILNTAELKLKLPLELESGTWSEIQVLCALQQDSSSNKHSISTTLQHSEKIPFKTYLSIDNYKKLYTLALEYLANKSTNKIQQIEHFYRNKSEKYFKDAMTLSSGVMKPYVKDCNGDQGSVINGAIHGLFYSTLLGSGSKPPPISYYGPVRLHIQAHILFTEDCNLYFSDFYCHYKQHYVTIVMTPSGTMEDTFCHQYLLELDKYDNPFIKLVRYTKGLNCVMANMNIVVEVFYTESVNIEFLIDKGLAYVSANCLVGRGESKPEGIPKNENCTKCNLSPRKDYQL